MISEGSINEAPIYPREIMRRALELGATALILAHNHPSGDPSPSEGDVRRHAPHRRGGRRSTSASTTMSSSPARAGRASGARVDLSDGFCDHRANLSVLDVAGPRCEASRPRPPPHFFAIRSACAAARSISS